MIGYENARCGVSADGKSIPIYGSGDRRTSGAYTQAVLDKLEVGQLLTCSPGGSLETPLAILHTIFPEAVREARRTDMSQAHCRARSLRFINLDKGALNFRNPYALRAFSQARQEPNFEGLCEISDPDLFFSVLVFGLGVSFKDREMLGYRDGRNLRHRGKQHNKPVVWRGTGNYEKANRSRAKTTS